MIKYFKINDTGGCFMKKIIVLTLVLIVLLIPMTVNADFSDVPSDHWAYSFINELSGKGVINGYPDGRYGPSDTLTRGQFIKLIVTASMGNVNYDYVEKRITHWVAPYLTILENYKIVDKGSLTKDKLDEPISRIQVVKLLTLCDLNIRKNKQKADSSIKFTDTRNLSREDKNYLSHAVACKIINGYEDGTFKPDNNLTRAEAAKIMSVYMSIK